MSYAEIWDDSALVDSWNEALEEYKVRIPKYIFGRNTYTRTALPQHSRAWRES